MAITGNTINNIQEFNTKFTGELDKLLVRESSVGFMEDNAFAAKFVGARSVKIPDIELSGLGDYDRDNGFATGSVTVANTVYTMSQDRGREFNIDREDLDETGIEELAGKVLSEFVRTEVAPETEAYVLSKVASVAKDRGNTVTATLDSGKKLSAPYADLMKAIHAVRAVTGYKEELVAFLSDEFMYALSMSSELSKSIQTGSFSQGEVDLTVQKLDRVSLLPVPAVRMQTAYDFQSGKGAEKKGGFRFVQTASGIYFMVLPKSAVSFVKKSEKMRTFTPDNNVQMDGYKLQYRIYYDAFIKTSMLDTVYACLAPTVTVTADLSAATSGTAGTAKSLSVTMAASDSSTLAYQWFTADDSAGNGAKPIANATSASYSVPATTPAGKYHYFVRVTAQNTTVIDSTVTELTLA